ncbi:MAG TPA: sporulation protein [Candidatus Dormibacteraeota bacterium]|nr:sporulation protein [Candidatus Dormibacteraeota bacterium]
MKILDQVKEVVGGAAVFGQPYEKNGLTVIPAATVMGGGGGGEQGEAAAAAGGGAGVMARPAGAFVVKGDEVTWVPAIDVTRTILLGQVVGIIALLSLRSIIRTLARRR